MRKLFTVSGILMSALLFVGCNKNNDNDQAETPVAGVMAANLATDLPPIGVALSGRALSYSPLMYTSFTGGYLPVYPGNRPVSAYDASTGVSYATANYTFEPEKFYSLFVVGANENYRNVIVNDDFSSLSATNGKAYIRYINAIPDSAQSTVTITANGSNAVNENASFASVSQFVEIEPGTVTIDVSNGSTVAANRTISVEQRKVYTVLLIGDPASTSAEVQIRYIENGTLDEEDVASARTSSSAQVIGSK